MYKLTGSETNVLLSALKKERSGQCSLELKFLRLQYNDYMLY